MMPLPATPEVLVRFGAGAIFQDSFVLGTTQGVLGVNVLGNQPSVTIPSVQQVSIRRGKESVDSSFGAGTASVQFLDFTGEWNPTDPGGPYFGEITPGRQLQVRVVDNTNTGYNLFAGYITSWDWEWAPGRDWATVSITAADASRTFQLADVSTVPGSAAGDLPGERINLILDDNDWPPTARSITAGTTTLQANPIETRTLLDALRQVETADLGALFVDVSGRVTYLSRNDLSARAVATPVVFNETDRPYDRIDVALDDDQIVNSVSVEPEGLTAQTAENTASVTKYFRRSQTRSGVLVETEARALQQATAIVAARGEPDLTLRSVGFNVLDLNRMVELVTTEIGDPVEITRTYASGTVQFRSIVQGINWDIVPNRWRGSFNTADTLALSTSFVLGSAQFGVLGVNTLG
jgi:hypothetical protein